MLSLTPKNFWHHPSKKYENPSMVIPNMYKFHYFRLMGRMLQYLSHNRVNIIIALTMTCLVVLVYNMYNGNGYHMYDTQKGDPLSWDGVPTHKNTLVDWKQVNQMRRLENSVDWSKIKRRKRPRVEDIHHKWIVVTSIAAPTSDVKLLSKIPGWKLLVVGDKKTPKSWRYF